jgi:CRP-like cAMP-binding protein
MSAEAEKLLAELPIFRGSGASAVRAAAAHALWRDYAAGSGIFRRGERCRGLFAVAGGEVQVYRASSDGREQTLHTHGPGVAFGEVPLFDGGPYPASARAVVASRVLFIPADRFHGLLRQHPEIASAVVADLGRRLRRMVALIEKISLRDVAGRVALTLMEHADRAGALHDDGEFQLAVTQERLAAELATSRESVSRALNRLVRDGIIAREGSSVRIRDRAGLERACSSSLNTREKS